MVQVYIGILHYTVWTD